MNVGGKMGLNENDVGKWEEVKFREEARKAGKGMRCGTLKRGVGGAHQM